MCGRDRTREPGGGAGRRRSTRFPRTAWRCARVGTCARATDLVIVVQTGGNRRMGTVRWGFVPAFARDPARGPRSINARAESVATRPAFRDAFRRRRCVVAADGFYEWTAGGSVRASRTWCGSARGGRWRSPGCGSAGVRPMGRRCRRASSSPARRPGGWPRSTIACPSILGPDAVARWLDPACGDPAALLVPFPGDLLDIHPVSRRVNSPRNDSPDLLEEIVVGAGS